MRRLSFWGAVAGISIIAPMLFQVAAERTNFPGLAALNSYVKKG